MAIVWLGSVVVRALELAINRSRVRLPTAELPSSDPGQVVQTRDQRLCIYDRMML